jgi:hypothetical protein
MIIRELLSVFGLDYDGRGQRAAEQGLNGLISQANMLQSAFASILGAAAIATPFVYLGKLASDAQENLNLLQVMFGGNAQSVVEWANVTAKAVGRSKYTLRELAAEFGGLVGAMLGPGEKAQAQAADMSKELSVLAVNLSSLRNISEERALTVLKSALAGETEAIKNFGPDLSAAAQQAEALRLGMGANAKELTQAQKAQIRYNILMRDLAFVSGDAANTLDQFANSSRAFRDQLKDVGTEIGFFLLPAFEDLLVSARGWLAPIATGAKNFRKWAADTNLAKGALLGVGLIMGVMLLPMLLKLAPLLLTFAVFALIMDDVITTFEGGNSVIGEFSKWMDAVNDGSMEAPIHVRALVAVFRTLSKVLGLSALYAQELLGALGTGEWKGVAEVLRMVFGDTLDVWTERIWKLYEATKALIGILQKGGVVGTLAGLFSGKAGEELGTGDVKQVLRGLLDPNVLAGQGLGITANPEQGLTFTEARSVKAPMQRTVSFRQGDRTYSFEVYQQPGENPQDFVQRVADIVDSKNEERDLAIVNELVQGGLPEAQ